jgi:hypothetical protein
MSGVFVSRSGGGSFDEGMREYEGRGGGDEGKREQ